MVTIGNLSQTLAFVLSMLATVLLLAGVMRNDGRLIVSGRRAIGLTAFSLTVTGISLAYLFAADVFQVSYVASYSDRALPLFYKMTAFWAGQKGSLLLWAWVLALISAAVVFNTRNELRERNTPYIYLVLTGTLNFFLYLLVMVTNPFELLSYIPPDGNGLNPMLQNPGMIFHPPTLFLGYVGFTVPFAYAVAAMVSGRHDDHWLRKTRVWSVLSWVFLAIGIILGGQWAYVELGWGGYWAWDPVENASFIPWLVATAFIHTAIIQERRNIMKVWNMSLIVLTYVLCIFGTYLVRSGILQSVHDFGATGLGGYFLIFLITVFAGGGLLIILSYRELRTDHSFDSWLSRESTFLFNNVILLSLAFATLFGTMFPLISEVVRGTKVTVGAPFFNRVNTPLFLALIMITGICPLIGWRKASVSNLKKNFLAPGGVALASSVLMIVAGIREPYPLAGLTLTMFLIATIFLEFWTGARARSRLKGEAMAVAFPRLLWQMRRRYGGFVAHLGLAIMVVGIIGSSYYKVENQATLQKNQSMEVGEYTLRYDEMKRFKDRNRETYAAVLSVFKGDRDLGQIMAEKRFYSKADNPTTEVALRSTLLEDLYITMPAFGKQRWEVTLNASVNPLQIWVWIGSFIMLLGGVMAIVPRRRRKEASHG
jgi:cytochrome c-type biogenesis protein CcmF